MTERLDMASNTVSADENGRKVVESTVLQGTVPGKARRTGGRRLLRFFFVCLYIGFLTAVVLAALVAVEYYAYLKVKSSPIGQAYKDNNMDAARQSTQKVAPHFGYEPTPGFAAVRNTRLGNSYEYINDQSFKDFDDVPLEKPQGEYRVIVTGGSVVYGRGPVPPADAVCDYYEVTYRWNIPHIIEKLLNADPRVRSKINGKTVRVINAGVAGFVYQNNLMRYLAKLRLYKPDLVVSLDGANEVHTVARPLKDWNYFTEGPYYEVVTDVMDMSGRGLLNYLALWLKRNTYLFAWLAMRKGDRPGILMEDRGFAAHPQDPTPEMLAYLDRNCDQVADVVAIFHNVLEADRVPHVFALQPMFRNSKKKRMPIEQKIESITGMEKIGFYYAKDTYELLVDKIKKRNKEIGLEVVDLTGLFDNVTEWVFTDWCHLTNGANHLVAKALVNEVKKRVFHLPLLQSDLILEPLDLYFKDYAKDSTVLLDGRASDAGLQILKGYPGPELLEATANPKAQPPVLVLDMGSAKPISRMRIVWGDKASVPKEWRLDISEDGNQWTTWLRVQDTRTDPFDQWPGFEYYAPEESKARFVKYVPLKDSATAPVRLRQLSVYR
ncbi:MAG: discoidin domain-containing protein [Deltaproteobacteria bacterium]|nr:discoidin domain-containing protein [Deltaproteobacteria bacterium]